MKSDTKKEKRVVKSYKIPDRIYQKAKKKAVIHKTTVANVVEDFLYDYISK